MESNNDCTRTGEELDPVFSFDASCSIDVVWELVGVGSPSLDDDEPGNGFEHDGDRTQEDDDSGVSPSPLVVRTQDLQTFKDVDDAENDHAVSDRMVVNVPVDSVLVILVGPQKQSENLRKQRTL